MMLVPGLAVILWPCLALFMIGSCGYHNVEPVPPDAYARSTELSLLKDGGTSRTDIVSRFGKPSGSFENGRILTYWLHEDYSARGTRNRPSTV
jgi:hypothetical protein